MGQAEFSNRLLIVDIESRTLSSNSGNLDGSLKSYSKQTEKGSRITLKVDCKENWGNNSNNKRKITDDTRPVLLYLQL